MNAAPAPRTKTLLATIFILNLVEFLHSGMLLFASSPIMGEVAASPEQFSLASAVYATVAIVAISQLRVLVERFGWRRYLQATVAIFILGCLVSGSSIGFGQYLSGRALMALGGGAFMTSARLIIEVIAPGPKRLLGIAAFGISLSAGFASAPWLASIAVSREHWEAITGVLAVLSLIGALLGSICLPPAVPSGPPAGKIRLWPLAWLALASFGLLYGLQRAYYDFHGDQWQVIAWLLAGCISTLVFAYGQLKANGGYLNLRALANSRYLLGLGMFTLCYMALGATNAVLPLFVQRGIGVSWEVAGEVQSLGFASAVPAFIAMILVMSKRPAPKKFYATAFAALGLFGWLLSRLSGVVNVWTDLAPRLAPFGIFLPLAMATTALHAFRDLQSDEAVFANGQQLKNMMSQFGLGIGVAWTTVGFQDRVTQHYVSLGERFVAGDVELTSHLEKVSTALATSMGPAQSSQLALAQLVQQLMQQATLVSTLEIFRLLAWLAAACLLIVMTQRVFK